MDENNRQYRFRVAGWLFIILFVLVRTVLGFLLKVPSAGAAVGCPPYAETWETNTITGVQEPKLALCAPDEQYAEIGLISDSVLILDMGRGNELVNGPGVDLYYYERPNGPGIFLDWVEVSIAQEGEEGEPGDFTPIFVWGDENPNNNGEIPSAIPEHPNQPINSEFLHNDWGIGIDIGDSISGDEVILYRFIRFRTWPSEAIPDFEERAQVDAVERVYEPPPRPTSTSVPPTDTPIPPTDTPIPPTDTPVPPTDTPVPPTDTPVPPTDTPIPPTETPIPPTDTSVPPTKTPTLTSTPTTEIEPTPVPINTATSTVVTIPVPTDTPSPTSTATPTETLTPTPTDTQTPTQTPTLVARIPTSTLTPTPTDTSSPTQTPVPIAVAPVNTPVPMASNTRLPTRTPTMTNTPRPTFTPTPLDSPTTVLSQLLTPDETVGNTSSTNPHPSTPILTITPTPNSELPFISKVLREFIPTFWNWILSELIPGLLINIIASIIFGVLAAVMGFLVYVLFPGLYGKLGNFAREKLLYLPSDGLFGVFHTKLQPQDNIAPDMELEIDQSVDNSLANPSQSLNFQKIEDQDSDNNDNLDSKAKEKSK